MHDRDGVEAETKAMNEVAEALRPLSPERRARVLRWAADASGAFPVAEAARAIAGFQVVPTTTMPVGD